MKKKLASSLLAGTLVLAQTAPALAAGDTAGHWAQDALDTWQNYGVIKGNEDGNLMPDSGITRGEMAVMLDRVMAYQLKAQNTFSDLDQNWYTDAILGANAAGIIMGMGDGTVQPGASITRQETAVMFARVLNLDTQSAPNAGFLDQASIPDWAVGAVNAMAAAGYMQGGNGLFRPADTITRAEVVTILDNIFSANYNTSGEYTGDVDGSAVISADAVTLKDMHITGDLIIAEGVGEGHVELDNVTVDGRLLVRGGGANSIVIKGGSKITQVIVSRQKGKVRVAVEDSAQVSVVVVDQGTDSVKLEGELGTVSVEGAGAAVEIAGQVDTVSVTEDAAGAAVTVAKGAAVTTVTTAAEDAALTVAGKVESVAVTESASSTTIKTESGAKIDSVTTAGSNTTVEGSGTVSKVEAAEGSTGTTVTTGGTKVENNSAESVTTGNGTVEAGESATTTKPSTGGSTSGGGVVHTHSYVDGVCSCGAYDSAWAQVNSVESWNEAVAAGKNIVLTADFTAETQLALSAALTVNGNGKTILSANNAEDATASAGILVTAAATIKNLTVSGPNNTTSWDEGEYGIKVYNATGVKLENVTVTAANAGIQVNSSEVTLAGTITVSGNEWGGIEVCKGSGLDHGGTLNVNGATVVCTDTTVPAIWIDGTTDTEGVVNGAGELSAYQPYGKEQIYYVAPAYLPPLRVGSESGIPTLCTFPQLATMESGSVTLNSVGSGWVEERDVTVPANVTLTIPERLTLYVGDEKTPHTLTVSGTLTGEGTVAVGNSASLAAAMKSGIATVKLLQDITLDNPSGYYTVNAFSGTLDGDGHTITTQNTSWKAVIATTTGTTEIKNLKMKYSTFICPLVNQNVGSLTFTNVEILDAGHVVSTDNNDSGFCCTNGASNNTTATLVFKNCTNNADYNVDSGGYAAIFLGGMAYSTHITFDGCVNNGDMTALDAALFIGNPSSAGDASNVTVTNCTNNGTLTGSRTAALFTRLNNSQAFASLNSSVTVAGTGTICQAADGKTTLTLSEDGIYQISRASGAAAADRIVFQLGEYCRSDSGDTWYISVAKTMDSVGSTGLKAGKFITEADFESKFPDAALDTEELAGVTVTGGIIVGTYTDNTNGTYYYVFEVISEGGRVYSFGADGKNAAPRAQVYSDSTLIDSVTTVSGS